MFRRQFPEVTISSSPPSPTVIDLTLEEAAEETDNSVVLLSSPEAGDALGVVAAHDAAPAEAVGLELVREEASAAHGGVPEPFVGVAEAAGGAWDGAGAAAPHWLVLRFAPAQTLPLHHVPAPAPEPDDVLNTGMIQASGRELTVESAASSVSRSVSSRVWLPEDTLSRFSRFSIPLQGPPLLLVPWGSSDYSRFLFPLSQGLEAGLPPRLHPLNVCNSHYTNQVFVFFLFYFPFFCCVQIHCWLLLTVFTPTFFLHTVHISISGYRTRQPGYRASPSSDVRGPCRPQFVLLYKGLVWR